MPRQRGESPAADEGRRWSPRRSALGKGPLLVTPGEHNYFWASRYRLSDPGRPNKGRGDGEAWIQGDSAGIGDPRDARRPRHRATGLSTHPPRTQFWPVQGTEPFHRWRPIPAGAAGSTLFAHSERRHSGKTLPTNAE